jgi:hypothetical protein
MEAVNDEILIINTREPIKNKGRNIVIKELVKFFDK